MKTTSCNAGKSYAFDKAPRCKAKTKRNNGLPCRSPAVRGKKRCRIHGGGKGSGAKIGNTNSLKHGYTTTESKNFRKAVKKALKESRYLDEELG